MSLNPAGCRPGGPARLIDRRPYESPVGLMMMVPGWPQFAWGQRQRAWVLVGSFAVAMIVGLWTWGTWLGWGFFAFAFITQVTSVTDVLRQGSFPIYPSRTAPDFRIQHPGTVVLSSHYLRSPRDRQARFRAGWCWEWLPCQLLGLSWRCVRPHEGQWIWMELPPPLGEQWAGRVVAVSGQEVEWNGAVVALMDSIVCCTPPRVLSAWPQPCRFKVPSNQILKSRAWTNLRE